MTITALTGFAVGAIAAGAAVLALVPVGYRNLRPGGRAKALAVGAFCLPLLGLIFFSGSGEWRSATEPPMPAAAMTNGADAAHTGENWALINHMYLGGPPPGTNSENAAPATGTGTGTVGAMPAGHPVEALKTLTAREPGNAQAWLALANAQRQSREFASAVAAYEKALRIDGGNADAWADYADALASAGNRHLAGAPADAIAKALRIDAKHPKALWLQASLDLEQRRFADALKHWQALRAALPNGSPDIAIVEANIAEARQLAAPSGGGG